MEMLIYFSIVSVLVVWIFYRFGTCKISKLNSELPVVHEGFKLPFMSASEIFQYTRLNSKTCNKSYKHLFFGIASLNIIRAKDVEKLLNGSKHINKSFIYKILHPFLGNGLLTSQGDKWQARRKLLTPAFHFTILQHFFNIFKEESKKLVKVLEQNVNSSESVDLIPLSTQFTLNTICETAMGVKLDRIDDGPEYRKNLEETVKKMLSRLMKPWFYPDIIYNIFGNRKELDKHIKPLHSFTTNVINQRKQRFAGVPITQEQKVLNADDNMYIGTRKQRYAMLDTLLQAQRDGFIDDNGIREEVDTFTFEGHDTSSSGLIFSLLLLAHHPEAQAKIVEEINSVLQTNQFDENGISMEDFAKMTYLDRVLKECLRIYPPVPFISRELSENLEVGGVTFAKGSLAHIHIYDIHRDPKEYPNPEKFDPDRFLPENCAKRHTFAYIPFSAGQRNCIGQKFAQLEIKTIITEILMNFEIVAVTQREEIVFVADLVLRSKYPIKIKFKSRN
ncbi:unnamed protein product [Diamesa hyperborea]